MPHILTPNEQQVCELLIADPLYCSGEGHDPQSYMQPIAEFLKRNEMSDAEKVRLDYCQCVDEQGHAHRVDVVVGGELGDMAPQDLVGRTIEIKYMTPYVSIAHGVKLLEEA